MKKLLILIVSSLLLGGCTVKNPFLKKPSGLEITSTPASRVFLNDEEVGTTPYKTQDLSPDAYLLKLIPQGDETLTPWETNLTLKPEVTTIVNRSFAAAETDSSGHILELIEEPGDNTYLSVISDPDTVNLTIDGKPTGYTPVTKIDSTPGTHQLSLSSPGYKPLELSINVIKGYNLIVNAKLASDIILITTPTATSSGTTSATNPSPSPAPVDGLLPPYVIIQETGTGWLRVRSEPSSSSEELGKANVGEKLKFLGESTDTGWLQVEFEGEEGWLSSKYVNLVE